MGPSEELDFVKINIRAVMSASRHDMTYESLLREYEELVYKPMGLCGFGTCVELMNSIPDVIQVIPGKPNRLRLVPSTKSQHIVQLVKQQKTSASKPKSFPSASRLASLGIYMPERNITKQSVNKPKVCVIPPRTNNDNSSYKWPPVSELWQINSKGKQSSTLGDICPTRANNQCKQNVISQAAYPPTSQSPFDDRPRDGNDNSPNQGLPFSEYRQSGSNWKRSSTSNGGKPVKSNDQCDPKLSSHVAHDKDSKSSSVKSSFDRQQINKLLLENIDCFFEDI